MKKISIILGILLFVLLVGFGLFYFLGNGKEKLSDFFTDNTFGSFFDIESQSQNEIIQNNTPIEPPQATPANTLYKAPILRQISFEPISGYTFYATTSTTTTTSIDAASIETQKFLVSTSTAIRFQERATGHIYDVFEFIEAPQKVSNISIQKVYSTLFSTNKDLFVYQTLSFSNEQINSTFGKLIFSTSTLPMIQKSEISGVITDFTYNKASNKLVYSIKEGGVSNIYTSAIDRTGEKFVITLPFNEFLIDPINANEVLITTKASQLVPGYAYILNTTNGSFNKILGDIPGLLVKVSPDKKYILYSQSELSGPAIRSYNTFTRVTNLGVIDTIPEKCVFSQKNTDEIYCFGSLIYTQGKYPDDWYKGKIFNSDSLYKINLSNNSIASIYNFEANNFSFDVINPTITTNDENIIFQSKYDLTLWSLDIEELTKEVF